jgi:hypothetical protein
MTSYKIVFILDSRQTNIENDAIDDVNPIYVKTEDANFENDISKIIVDIIYDYELKYHCNIHKTLLRDTELECKNCLRCYSYNRHVCVNDETAIVNSKELFAKYINEHIGHKITYKVNPGGKYWCNLFIYISKMKNDLFSKNFTLQELNEAIKSLHIEGYGYELFDLSAQCHEDFLIDGDRYL